MKLLLTSNGLTTTEIRATLSGLCDKPLQKISVAIINDGHHVETGDKRWAIDEPHLVADVLGGDIDIVSLFALPDHEVVERITKKDILYVVGGHTDYLMSRMNASGIVETLPEILEKIVYVGSSAGAMIMGKRINTKAYQEAFGEGENYGISQYLEYVDVAIKPHLNSQEFPTRSKELYHQAAQGYQGALLGLRDDQAIVVEGTLAKPTITCVGGHPLTYIDGKLQ